MNSKFTWPYLAAPSTGITIDCLEKQTSATKHKSSCKVLPKKEFRQLSPAVAMLGYTGTNSLALITATALAEEAPHTLAKQTFPTQCPWAGNAP